MAELNKIIIGEDRENVPITVTDVDGTAIELSAYAEIELNLINNKNVVFAKYKNPDTAGYNKLTKASNVITLDIFRAETANMKSGEVVYADVRLKKTGIADYPDGLLRVISKIILGIAEKTSF